MLDPETERFFCHRSRSQLLVHNHRFGFRRVERVAVQFQKDGSCHQSHTLVAIVKGVIAREPITVCRGQLEGRCRAVVGVFVPWPSKG